MGSARRASLLLALLVPALAPLEATAAEAAAALRLGPVAVLGDDAGLLQAGAGVFDAGDSQSAAMASVEYRFGEKLLVFGPALGLLANIDGGLFGYGGIYVDVALGSLHLTPLLAVGGYREGDSKDLGGVFQFRQSIDLAWRFAKGWRLGLRLAHISNAGIHERNPGEEDAQVVLAVPLGPW